MSVIEVIALAIVAVVAIVCGTAIAIMRMAYNAEESNEEEEK